MTCEEARAMLIAQLNGEQPPPPDLERHEMSCESCGATASQMRSLWLKLGDLPEPEPRPGMSTRFHIALDAYRQGLLENSSHRWRWWPSKPVWQIAVSSGCLAAGLLVGMLLSPARPASEDIAELRREMSGMRQLVTLSLLQQQSATERLRGVNWSYRAEPDDLEVLSALLRTVNQDNSVDVRLAAVDALRNFGDSSVARRGLINALEKQRSPLVQIEIIDTLAELREKSAVPSMRGLLAHPDLDENVRRRIEGALERFQ